ncbi:hypothetical protein ACAX46_004273 [Providencia rettgeri]
MSLNLLYTQLIWQPGSLMHIDWWKKLKLAEWSDYYVDMSEPSQRQLNKLICLRREQGDWGTSFLVEVFNPVQMALLAAFPRLNQLLLAMGILLSHCPDYLLCRPYRNILSDYFTNKQLRQLQSLWRGGNQHLEIEPENLIHRISQLAMNALNNELSGDPVWWALCYTQPYYKFEENKTEERITPLLMRLERFL